MHYCCTASHDSRREDASLCHIGWHAETAPPLPTFSDPAGSSGSGLLQVRPASIRWPAARGATCCGFEVSCEDCGAKLCWQFGSPASSADSALRVVKRLCSGPPRSADCDAGLLSAEEVLGDWLALLRSCWDSREVRPELPRDLAAAAGDACRRANAEVISLTPGCR